MLSPDLDHGLPDGAHWDYKDTEGKWHKVFSDGTHSKKRIDNNMIQQKNVTGTVALNYVKQELSRGGVLSDCINELPLDAGDIYAFVPSGVSENNLYDFENGVLYPCDESLLSERPLSIPIRNDARPFLVEIIQQYLTSKKVNCCLFEDQLRSPTDPITIASALNYVHLSGDQIFYFFNYNKNNTSTIGKALVTSEAHVFLCVLSSLDIDTQNEFLPKREISIDLLRKFAVGTSSFLVNAYDHEGFLMWSKL